MKRSGPIARRTRLKPRNAKRLKRVHAKAFAKQAALCRTLPCWCGCGAPPPSVAAHVKSRGAGGDDSHCLPLNWRCHQKQHSEGIVSFFARRRLDPEALLTKMRMLVSDENDDGLAVSPFLAWLE